LHFNNVQAEKFSTELIVYLSLQFNYFFTLLITHAEIVSLYLIGFQKLLEVFLVHFKDSISNLKDFKVSVLALLLEFFHYFKVIRYH